MRRKKPILSNSVKMYCGLDLSLTATGIVVMDNTHNVIHSATIKPKEKGEERLDIILAAVESVYNMLDISHTCIEGYSMGSHSGQAFSIGELGGLIKHYLWSQGYTFNLVPPTRLKKFITGGGKAEKDMIMMLILKRWGYTSANNNEADAYGLARLATALNHGGDYNKAQKEVIRDIKNPPIKKKKG